MTGEIARFLKTEVRARLDFNFALLMMRVRISRGELSFGMTREPVHISSQFDPEFVQTHQRWPAGAWRRLSGRMKECA